MEIFSILRKNYKWDCLMDLENMSKLTGRSKDEIRDGFSMGARRVMFDDCVRNGWVWPSYGLSNRVKVRDGVRLYRWEFLTLVLVKRKGVRYGVPFFQCFESEHELDRVRNVFAGWMDLTRSYIGSIEEDYIVTSIDFELADHLG